MRKIVFPDYENSLLNVSNSILKYYNVHLGYNGIKKLDLLLERKYQNIVFFLVDALGSEILKKSKALFLKQNKIANLTTVFPSTTVAATTSSLTGLPPIATAWFGWQQYFKKENRNIVLFLNEDYYKPSHKPTDVVTEKYIPVKKLGELIAEKNKNVLTHEVYPAFRDLEHQTIFNQIATIKKILANGQKNFIYGYWDRLDTLLHEKGVENLEVSDHLQEINEAFLELSKSLNEETLVIITADHGQVDIEPLKLYEYKDLMAMLEHKPALESRATVFYIKSEFYDDFPQLFNHYFKDKYLLYTKEEVLKMNLFGDGKIHELSKAFLGDYLAIAIDKYSFEFMPTERSFKATHAGLLEAEMFIPLIVLNKD